MHDNLKRSRLNKAFFSIAVLSLFLFLSNGCSKLSNVHLPGVRDLDLQLVTDNLVSPLSVIEAPDNSHRLFIVDQSPSHFSNLFKKKTGFSPIEYFNHLKIQKPVSIYYLLT